MTSTTAPLPAARDQASREAMRELERWIAGADDLSIWWDPQSDTCWLVLARDGVEIDAAPVPNARVPDARRHPFLYLP